MADGRGLLIGLGVATAAVVVGSVIMSDKNKGAKTPPPSTKDQCAQLAKDAASTIATATAADIPALTALLAKAQGLGTDCNDLVSQIEQKLKDLGSTLPVETPPKEEKLPGYSVVGGFGGVASANAGDVLIVPLKEDTTGNVYLTPLSYSGDSGASSGPATYEKSLADIALLKYQAAAAKNGFDPKGPVGGVFGVTVGAPPMLKEASVFTVKFVSTAGPSDPIYVVTAKDISSDITGEASPPASSFVGWDEAFGPKEKKRIDVYGGDIGAIAVPNKSPSVLSLDGPQRFAIHCLGDTDLSKVPESLKPAAREFVQRAIVAVEGGRDAASRFLKIAMATPSPSPPFTGPGSAYGNAILSAIMCVRSYVNAMSRTAVSA